MEIKIKMMQQTAVLAMRKTIPVSVNFLQEEIEKIIPCSVIGTGNKDEKDILLYIKDDIKEISINKVNEICDFIIENKTLNEIVPNSDVVFRTDR